jgi:hypothetical protein
MTKIVNIDGSHFTAVAAAPQNLSTESDRLGFAVDEASRFANSTLSVAMTIEETLKASDGDDDAFSTAINSFVHLRLCLERLCEELERAAAIGKGRA